MAKPKPKVVLKGNVNIGGIIKKRPPMDEIQIYKISAKSSSSSVR